MILNLDSYDKMGLKYAKEEVDKFLKESSNHCKLSCKRI